MKYSVLFLGLTSLSGQSVATHVPRSKDVGATASSSVADSTANQAPKAKAKAKDPASPVTLYRGSGEHEEDEKKKVKKVDCAAPGVWRCYADCLDADQGLDIVIKREACVDYCEEERHSKKPDSCTIDPETESDDEWRTRRTHHGRDTVARARAQRERRWKKHGKEHCAARGNWPCYRNCLLVSYANNDPVHSGYCKKVCSQHNFPQPSDCTTTSDDDFGGVLDPQSPIDSKKNKNRRIYVDSDEAESNDLWKSTKRALNVVDKIQVWRVEDQ